MFDSITHFVAKGTSPLKFSANMAHKEPAGIPIISINTAENISSIPIITLSRTKAKAGKNRSLKMQSIYIRLSPINSPNFICES